MLSRNFRLKKEADFRRIYRKGRHIRGYFFNITYLENNKNTRFGIVVTTKSINKATRRNSAKRFLRSIIQQNKSNWPENIDLIIKIKNEISPEQKKNAKAELVAALKKINV